MYTETHISKRSHHIDNAGREQCLFV